MFPFFSTRSKQKGNEAEPQATTDNKAFPVPPLETQETIRILMLPVGEPPVVCTIEAHENPWDFKNSFDFLVNGRADLVYLCHDKDRIIFLGTNDVGKLIGLAPNRYICDGHDVLVGQAFVVAKLENGTYCDLTDEEIEQYKKQFAKFIAPKEAQVARELVEEHASIRVTDEDGKVIHSLKMNDMRSILGGSERKSG